MKENGRHDVEVAKRALFALLALFLVVYLTGVAFP